MKWFLFFTLIAYLDAPWYMWALCCCCGVLDFLYHVAMVSYLSELSKGGGSGGK